MNRSIQYSKLSNSSSLRAPCTSCTILPPMRSIEGISIEPFLTREPHRNVRRRKMRFQIADIMDTEVKDGCCERRIGRALAKHFDEVLLGSRPARCDDWDRHGFRHG